MVITVEGTNGTGKTTLAKGVVEYLQSKGIKAEYARLPGWTGSSICTQIREILSTQTLDRYTRLHLYLADMAIFFEQHDRDTIYVLDRSWISTITYQVLDGFSRSEVERMIAPEWRLDGVILLTCDPAEAVARMKKRSTKTMLAYRDQDVAFYQKVQDYYLYQFQNPMWSSHTIIDTTCKNPDEILAQAVVYVEETIHAKNAI